MAVGLCALNGATSSWKTTSFEIQQISGSTVPEDRLAPTYGKRYHITDVCNDVLYKSIVALLYLLSAYATLDKLTS